MSDATVMNVLIVEDDELIALDLAEELEDAGFNIIGPCNCCEDAIEMLNSIGCDIAVLDVNLGLETSENVAIALNSKGIGYVVLSGYSASQLPQTYVGAPVLSKPILTSDLVNLLQRH